MHKRKSIKELQDIFDKIIQDISFQRYPKELYIPINYLIDIGGKRMRPILVLMSADLYGFDLQKVMPQAIAIELFHNFTLVHDDIMDKAPLRRGLQTVHEKWDSNTGILSGDALFVKSYQYMVEVESKYLPSLMELFNKTALQVCEGQQYDMNFERQDDVTIDSYIKMIKYKTGVLIACSLQIGALVSGASKKDQDCLYAFGLHLGISFQLKDDILDVYGNQKAFGKQIAGDIISNKKTCLYIKAKELAQEEHKTIFDFYFAHQNFDPKEKIEKIISVYNELEVKMHCLNLMQEHYKIAMRHLKDLDIHEQRKSTIKEFSDLLMARQR